jgi:hypothetical protein
MPRDRLLDVLQRSANRPAPLGLTPAQTANLSPRQQATCLLEELLRKRLLVPWGADRSVFVAPHRSILEFLTAWALTEPVNAAAGPSWDTFLPIAGHPWTIGQWIDKKSWLPEWEQVIAFATGQLADPLPLCGILADPSRDDRFRSRLCLLARCLPEITRDGHSILSNLFRR